MSSISSVLEEHQRAIGAFIDAHPWDGNYAYDLDPSGSNERIIERARNSVPFVWLPGIMSVAEAYELPPRPIGKVVARLPHATMWWRFPDGSSWFIQSSQQGDYADAVNVFVGDRGWYGNWFSVDDAWPEPAAVVDHPIHGHMREATVRLIRLLAFVNSPFVDTRRLALTNNAAKRRWLGRRIGDPQSLMVVRLRSEVRDAVRVERGIGPVFRQRWLVRGHYRSQWYPSEESHRVIWIAPYLKGPQDAPLKTPIYAVAR